MTVVGIGVDVADVARFAAAIERTPTLLARVLTDAERTVDRPERLAARFAAKEALAKALGAPGGLEWHHAEVVIEPSGAPSLRITGTVKAAADRLGVRSLHLSLTHDAGVAVAFVIAES